MTPLFVALLFAQTPKIDEATMAKCYALYKKYEMPLPPRTAKFVVMRGYMKNPTMGFLLDASGFRGPDIQMGFLAGSSYDYREAEPSRELIETASLKCDDYTVPCPTGVADSMNLYDRGYKRLATRLMERALESPPRGTFGDFPKGTDPVVAISYTAYDLNMQFVPRYFLFLFKDEDKNEIVKSLTQILDTEKDPAFQKRRSVIDEIKAAFKTPENRKDKNEGDIDELLMSRSYFFPRPGRPHSVPNTFDKPRSVHKDWNYLQAAGAGIQFVPTLIDHLEDIRITGAMQIAADGSIEFCTVGQLCKRILDALAATGQPMGKADYKRWYQAVIASHGKGLFLSTDNQRYAWEKLTAEKVYFSEELLTLLSRDQLPELLTLYAKRDDVPLEPILNSLVGLPFPGDPKPSEATLSALRELAASVDFHKSYLGLRALQIATGQDDYDLGNEADTSNVPMADKALLNAVQKLQTYAGDPDPKIDVSEIGDAVARTADSAVWMAFGNVCAKMPAQTRALLIYKSATASNGNRSEDQYPRFARRFFDDKTPIPDSLAMYGEMKAANPENFVPKTIGELSLHCAAMVIGVSYPVERDRPDLMSDLRKWVTERIGS